MSQNNLVETIIGAVVVAVAVVFLVFAYRSTDSGALSGYEVNARLAKVDGLAVGTDVRISGIKVGAISALDLNPDNYLVTVHMNIRDDIKIPADSSMLITSAGLLGGSYLSITPGGDDKMISSGGFIVNTQSANSADLMNLAGRFMGGESGSGAPAPKPAPPPATSAPQPLGPSP